MEITEAFVLTVERARSALHANASNLEASQHVKDGDDVGKLLRNSAEQSRQDADVLRGWCDRARKELKMPRADEG